MKMRTEKRKATSGRKRLLGTCLGELSGNTFYKHPFMARRCNVFEMAHVLCSHSDHLLLFTHIDPPTTQERHSIIVSIPGPFFWYFSPLNNGIISSFSFNTTNMQHRSLCHLDESVSESQ